MLYTLKNNIISVTVNTTGGSMTSVIYLPENEERLWQGSEFWRGQDVVIFPLIGHAGEYSFCGEKFAPKSHGVARYSEFIAESIEEDGITLLLESNDETRKTYPFDFIFKINYKLTGSSVKITYTVKSLKGKIPFYVGGHPGMVAPRGEAWIEFENAENPIVYPLEGGNANIYNKVKKFKADKALFKKVKTLQLGNLSGGAVYVYTSDGYRYSFQSDCPVFAIWSNEDGGDFICVEPWWGINDFSFAPREITLKPFMNFADENGSNFSYKLSLKKVAECNKSV